MAFFDPNVEVSCSDIEISFCLSRAVVARADDYGNAAKNSTGISEAGQRKDSVKFQAFQVCLLISRLTGCFSVTFIFINTRYLH